MSEVWEVKSCSKRSVVKVVKWRWALVEGMYEGNVPAAEQGGLAEVGDLCGEASGLAGRGLHVIRMK